MALRGLYQEATAHDEAGLEAILKEYNTIIEHESSNIVHTTPQYGMDRD